MLAKTPRLARARPQKAQTNGRSRADFVALIRTEWRKQIDGIFAVGLLLETAKEELPHGEWGLLFKNREVPFGQVTAARLMAIADNENLRNLAYTPDLPSSWATLYELTKLPDETFAAAIKDGRIHPGMQQKDAVALHKGPRLKPAQREPTSECFFAVQSRIAGALKTLPDRNSKLEFLESLRAMLDQLGVTEATD